MVRGEELEVVDVLRRYGTLLDQGRFDEWLALFSEDAVCGSGPTTFEGIGAISAWIRQKSRFGHHAIATPVLHFSRGQRAVTAVTPFAHVMPTDTSGVQRLERAGRYFTRMERRGDGWTIVEHVIDFHVHD